MLFRVLGGGGIIIGVDINEDDETNFCVEEWDGRCSSRRSSDILGSTEIIEGGELRNLGRTHAIFCFPLVYSASNIACWSIKEQNLLPLVLLNNTPIL